MFESLQNDRIEFHNGVRFRGTEISVESVLTQLHSSDSVDAVLAAYPALSRDDLEAAVQFERAAARLRKQQWALVRPVLEEIERRELAEMTEEEHLQAIEAVLDIAPVDESPRPTSGLIEFHRRLLRSRQ